MPGVSIDIPIQIQPTETTCGPTCLQAVYAYHGDEVPLDSLIGNVPALLNGGTLAVILGRHALHVGYRS
jgi:ABC-type bacteriocin/lantibiotic exporter with double-glycine peptidase domain